MKVAELQNAFKSIAINGFKVVHSTGVFFYKKKEKEKIKLISITYNSYRPKFTFFTINSELKFKKVESLFIPIYKKHVHPTVKNNDYNITFSETVGKYTDDLIYQGVTYKAELDKLIQQTEEIITTKALDWFEQYDKLEDVAEYLKMLENSGQKVTTPLGGFHGLFRRIIIMHLTNDVESYHRYISEMENILVEKIKNQPYNLGYLHMLEEIKQLRTV